MKFIEDAFKNFYRLLYRNLEILFYYAVEFLISQKLKPRISSIAAKFQILTSEQANEKVVNFIGTLTEIFVYEVIKTHTIDHANSLKLY